MKNIKFWENVILSGRRNYEPRTDLEAANYDIAEYLVQREKEKKVA